MTIATVFMRRENPAEWIEHATRTAALGVRAYLQIARRPAGTTAEDYLSIRAIIAEAIEEHRPGVTLNIHPGSPESIVDPDNAVCPATVQVQTNGIMVVAGNTIVVAPPPPEQPDTLQEAKDLLRIALAHPDADTDRRAIIIPKGWPK